MSKETIQKDIEKVCRADRCNIVCSLLEKTVICKTHELKIKSKLLNRWLPKSKEKSQ